MKVSFRLWILIIALIFSVLAISPSFEKGIVIKSIELNSTAYNEGLRTGMKIKAINGQTIDNIKDYAEIMDSLFPTNEKVKLAIATNAEEFILFIKDAPKITVTDIPRTKIKLGLDLSGGARALVKPEQALSSSEISDLIAVTSNRLNVFGISDVNVKPVSDLAGNTFMLVEVAGATPSDLEELVAKQGKFEAKIGNETVFIGGERDITYVARTGQEALIETCFQRDSGYACNFRFAVHLSEEAAKRHADMTSQLGINASAPGYLDKTLDLYVDDQLVDSLLISEDLKGKLTTELSVQGSGSGLTNKDAFENAQESMRKLQTILITGSLPYKLQIEKLDTISPLLGEKFIYYLFIAAASSLFAVALVVFIRYRKIKLSLALLFVSFSDVIIILGFASLIKWNLDLASIAGILTVLGTGVDQQIIMLDESRTGKESSGVVQRLKRALFIIIGAYFTSLAALAPLYWAGAGLLKGFAFTSIAGITIAILITRPAFIDILKIIEK